VELVAIILVLVLDELVEMVQAKQNVLLSKMEHHDERLVHRTIQYDQIHILVLLLDLDDHLLLQIIH